jgi:hypothetical protein
VRPESVELLGLINGVLATGFVVAAVFFLKFWHRTRDGLFAAFALAFALLGVAQPLPALLHTDDVTAALIYLIRLGAFVLIIFAILLKNRVR